MCFCIPHTHTPSPSGAQGEREAITSVMKHSQLGGRDEKREAKRRRIFRALSGGKQDSSRSSLESRAIVLSSCSYWKTKTQKSQLHCNRTTKTTCAWNLITIRCLVQYSHYEINSIVALEENHGDIGIEYTFSAST